MNKEVKDLIEPYNPNIKKGTWYITSSTRDVKKPYLLARLEELEAENKLLQAKVNQLETNRDKAIEFIDQELQYHLSPFDYKQVDEDVNTLIGILRGGSNE